MKVILFLVLVCLGGALSQRKALGRAATPVLGGLSTFGLILLLAMTLGRGNAQEESNQVERRLVQSLGYALAHQVAQDFPNGGNLLVVQHLTEFLGADALQAEQTGVNEACKNSGLEVNFVSVGLSDPHQMEAVMAGVQPHPFDIDRVNQLLAEHPDTVAVLSFVGAPEGRITHLRDQQVAFYLFADWGGLAPDWLRSRRVRAVAVPRPSGPTEVSPQTPLPELFQARYEFLPR